MCSDISTLVKTILLSGERHGSGLPDAPSGGCRIEGVEEEQVKRPACGRVDHRPVGRQSFSRQVALLRDLFNVEYG